MNKLYMLVIILVVSLFACKDSRKDNNIPNNDYSIQTYENDENQKYIREELPIIKKDQSKGILFIENENILLDTITIRRDLEIKSSVKNIGVEKLNIQDILISSPFVEADPSEFVLSPGENKEISFKIEASKIDGYFSCELLLINNSIDIQKKATISGFFNIK